jgi:hypothetical protein
MKQLFTQEEFNNAKSKDLLPCECNQCKKTYFVTPDIVRKANSSLTTSKNKFCSQLCFNLSRINKPIVKCTECGKEFKKYPSAIKRTKNHFCSQSCSTKYNNVNRIVTNNHRSKLEIFLEEKLTNLYPNLLIEYNCKTMIESELDIYIPSLKLAFELNGIFHYEPIFGSDKLEKVKNNDNKKFQKCINANISLCIIDTSKQKYFKEKTSIEFLNIIIKIIDNML